MGKVVSSRGYTLTWHSRIRWSERFHNFGCQKESVDRATYLKKEGVRKVLERCGREEQEKGVCMLFDPDMNAVFVVRDKVVITCFMLEEETRTVEEG